MIDDNFDDFFNATSMKGVEKFQCKVWMRLIFDSMKDIDNRVIRREILAHCSGCTHPTCIQVAKLMEKIIP